MKTLKLLLLLASIVFSLCPDDTDDTLSIGSGQDYSSWNAAKATLATDRNNTGRVCLAAIAGTYNEPIDWNGYTNITPGVDDIILTYLREEDYHDGINSGGVVINQGSNYTDYEIPIIVDGLRFIGDRNSFMIRFTSSATGSEFKNNIVQSTCSNCAGASGIITAATDILIYNNVFFTNTTGSNSQTNSFAIRFDGGDETSRISNNVMFGWGECWEYKGSYGVAYNNACYQHPQSTRACIDGGLGDTTRYTTCNCSINCGNDAQINQTVSDFDFLDTTGTFLIGENSSLIGYGSEQADFYTTDILGDTWETWGGGVEFYVPFVFSCTSYASGSNQRKLCDLNDSLNTANGGGLIYYDGTISGGKYKNIFNLGTYDATPTSITTADTSLLGTYLNFSSSLLSSGVIDELADSSNFTIQFWHYSPTLENGTNQTILFNEDSLGGQGFQIGIPRGAAKRLSTYTPGGGIQYRDVIGDVVIDSTWNHFTIQIDLDSSDISNGFRYWINGSIRPHSQTAAIPSTFQKLRDFPLEWGNETSSPLDGRLSHIKVWSRILDTAEIINEIRIVRPGPIYVVDNEYEDGLFRDPQHAIYAIPNVFSHWYPGQKKQLWIAPGTYGKFYTGQYNTSWDTSYTDSLIIRPRYIPPRMEFDADSNVIFTHPTPTAGWVVSVGSKRHRISNIQIDANPTNDEYGLWFPVGKTHGENIIIRCLTDSCGAVHVDDQTHADDTTTLKNILGICAADSCVQYGLGTGSQSVTWGYGIGMYGFCKPYYATSGSEILVNHSWGLKGVHGDDCTDFDKVENGDPERRHYKIEFNQFNYCSDLSCDSLSNSVTSFNDWGWVDTASQDFHLLPTSGMLYVGSSDDTLRYSDWENQVCADSAMSIGPDNIPCSSRSICRSRSYNRVGLSHPCAGR